jgi:hypothetical protein
MGGGIDFSTQRLSMPDMPVCLAQTTRLSAGQIHPSQICTSRDGCAGQARASHQSVMTFLRIVIPLCVFV